MVEVESTVVVRSTREPDGSQTKMARPAPLVSATTLESPGVPIRKPFPRSSLQQRGCVKVSCQHFVPLIRLAPLALGTQLVFPLSLLDHFY